MKRRLAALLLAAVASAAASERLLVAPDRIVALLAMPLFGEHGCALREAKSVPLYADAALARPIGRLRACPATHGSKSNSAPAAPGCADSRAAAVQRGWVPAYARSGWPLVWFHSRGC